MVLEQSSAEIRVTLKNSFRTSFDVFIKLYYRTDLIIPENLETTISKTVTDEEIKCKCNYSFTKGYIFPYDKGNLIFLLK